MKAKEIDYDDFELSWEEFEDEKHSRELLKKDFLIPRRRRLSFLARRDKLKN